VIYVSYQDALDNGNGNWSPIYGGCDSAGNPITVSFGKEGTKAEGHTLIANGDCSGINFLEHSNHNHYGSGNGLNNNVMDRGKYNGPGS